MSVIAFDKTRKTNVMFIKGAPEYILEKAKKVMTANG